VVFVSPSVNLSEAYLESSLSLAYECDVFCLSFLSGMIFYGSEELRLFPGAQRVLELHGCRWNRLVDSSKVDGLLFPGPYVLERGVFWRVSRLYPDTANAFTIGLRTLPNQR